MSMKGSRYICSVAGKLGDDPKEFGNNGGASVSMAVDVPIRRDGATVYEAEWHQLTAFGLNGRKLLEGTKGSYLIVDGSKSFDEYTSKKTGEIVRKPNILVSNIMFEYPNDNQQQRPSRAAGGYDEGGRDAAEETGLY